MTNPYIMGIKISFSESEVRLESLKLHLSHHNLIPQRDRQEKILAHQVIKRDLLPTTSFIYLMFMPSQRYGILAILGFTNQHQ